MQNIEHVDTATSDVAFRTVLPGAYSVEVRERMLVHIVEGLASRLLGTPGVNPRGMVITIAGPPSTDENPRPDFEIVASAPRYV